MRKCQNERPRIDRDPAGWRAGRGALRLDLSQPLLQGDLAALRCAWLAHGVVFLRDQHLTSGQFLAFDQAIGTPVE